MSKCWTNVEFMFKLCIPEYFCDCIRNDDQSNQNKHLTSISHKLIKKLLTEKVVKLLKNVKNHQNTYSDIFITFIDMTLLVFGDSSIPLGLTLPRTLWSYYHHSRNPPNF